MTLIEFANVFPEFRAASWDAWRGILARLTPAMRELFVIAGRGSGKRGSSRSWPRGTPRSRTGGRRASTLRRRLRARSATGARDVPLCRRAAASVPELAALIVSEAAESVSSATASSSK